MEQTRKKRSPILKVILFLLLLGAVFVAAVSSLFSPSTNIIGRSFSQSKIAIVRVEGIILDEKKIIKQLKMWADDDSVKVIVVRIDSPGGIVTPSQEIFNEVKRTREKKPVIASLGDVAASGGYYIASACQSIVSGPGTITGSIGVIMIFSNTEKLMDKIGLNTLVVKSGKFKDTGSPHRPFTEEDREIMQGIVDDTYDQFIEDVAKGRNMDKEKVRALADGRIYTGRQAKELNLVDELGDLSDAIAMAAKIAGISGEPKVVEEIKEPGFLRKLLGDEFISIFSNKLILPAGTYFLWPAW